MLGFQDELDIKIISVPELCYNEDSSKYIAVDHSEGGHCSSQTYSNRKIVNAITSDKSVLRATLAVPDVHLISLVPSMKGLIVPSKFYGIIDIGKPALFIGSNDGELARIIREGECGDVITEVDDKGLAEFILDMRDSPIILATYSKNAEKLSREKYSRKAALEHWGRLLKKLQKAEE